MNTVNKENIENRARDWKERVNNLFSEIEEWLVNTQYRFKESKPITLDEDMIKEFGVQKLNLPTADIFKNDSLIASLKPKGLWVIGANGRVDLISKSKLILLLDNSEQFENTNWEIAFDKNRQRRKQLNKENFIEVLNTL